MIRSDAYLQLFSASLDELSSCIKNKDQKNIEKQQQTVEKIIKISQEFKEYLNQTEQPKKDTTFKRSISPKQNFDQVFEALKELKKCFEDIKNHKITNFQDCFSQIETSIKNIEDLLDTQNKIVNSNNEKRAQLDKRFKELLKKATFVYPNHPIKKGDKKISKSEGDLFNNEKKLPIDSIKEKMQSSSELEQAMKRLEIENMTLLQLNNTLRKELKKAIEQNKKAEKKE